MSSADEQEAPGAEPLEQGDSTKHPGWERLKEMTGIEDDADSESTEFRRQEQHEQRREQPGRST